ncbi:hypothetical protein ACSBR1_019334 [Camellia fascicularis]
MTRLVSETNRVPRISYSPKHHHHNNHHHHRTTSLYSPKLSICLLSTCVTLFILFQIQSLQTPPSSWSFIHHFQNHILNTTQTSTTTAAAAAVATKLRQAVTFLPLKDLRYTQTAQQGHTWFMSSTYDTHEQGEVQFQHFPSKASKGRLLCVKGNDTHDGAWNFYALAWPETLPDNATHMEGLTFVSYNHYNYDNIWHGLSAMVPFVAWHIKNECSKLPTRWVLYHWGELRTKMGPWLKTLMNATFNGYVDIERFDDRGGGDRAVCFEEAVVMRHNEGGMSRERRMEVYDLMRCKARLYCNVSMEESREDEGRGLNLAVIGMTMFMRTGARNSSVMEFFPKGWLKLAGVGQYVYHWIASWSGMKHQGAWRDPSGNHCPYGEDDRRCMSIYKSGKIGYNETFFAEWAGNVLHEPVKEALKLRKKPTIEDNFKPIPCGILLFYSSSPVSSLLCSALFLCFFSLLFL